jgi:hypothetical protein
MARTERQQETGESVSTFRQNFGKVLEKHGLTDAYYADNDRKGFTMNLSDWAAFNRHEILQRVERRILGRKVWTSQRVVARVLSESPNDPAFLMLKHDGLEIEVLHTEDVELILEVTASLVKIYPDEKVRLKLARKSK